MPVKGQPSDILIVGSVAFDSIEAETGSVDRALGGSAIFASMAASYFSSPRVVAVVGEDFEQKHFDLLGRRGIDASGIKVVPGAGPSTGGAATTTTCRTATRSRPT